MAIVIESKDCTAQMADTSDQSLDPGTLTGLQVGDLMVAMAMSANSRTISPPTGWTQVFAGYEGTGAKLYVWSKVADADDQTDVGSFTIDQTFGYAQMVIFRISGADTNAGNWNVGTINTASGTTLAADTLTVTNNGSLVLWVNTTANNGTTASSATNTDAEEYELGRLLNVYYHLCVYSKAMDSGSADTTITWSGWSGNTSVVGIAIPPAAAASSYTPQMLNRQFLAGSAYQALQVQE